MTTLTIKDLSMTEALDRKAMTAVRGGIILVLQPQYPSGPIFPASPILPSTQIFPSGPS